MKITNFYIILLCLLWLASCTHQEKNHQMTVLRIADNGRYLVDSNGRPFFWLGDTGWLLFSKLSKAEIDTYLADRAAKGFNVIQVMLLHTLHAKNYYGDSALVSGDVSHPHVNGTDTSDTTKMGYWQLVDYTVKKAAEEGIYLGLVPVWGGNVKDGHVNATQAKAYAQFLADRYRNHPNIIWLNGGDIKGSDSTAVWQAIGQTLRQYDQNHLIAFHPRGRTSSSEWFHQEPWLDFNMFQSGHRRYDQDTSANEQNHYGEDNWRYVQRDYALKPTKPTLDGEPSYEGIPQGLHDPKEPRWTAQDVRRYAYWSVFSGACGFTYGNNSVMQFLSKTDTAAAYGATQLWTAALQAPGAGQLQYLKELMLSKSFLNRVPDQSLLAENGEQYQYKVASRSENDILIYTYMGGKISVHLGLLEGKQLRASWFDPRTGKSTDIGHINNEGDYTFTTPGDVIAGNDWVLVLEAV